MPEFGAKRLGLLHELVPGADRDRLLVNPNSPRAAGPRSQLLQGRASLGLQLDVEQTASETDLARPSKPSSQEQRVALFVGCRSVL